MKKILSLTLAALICLGLAACGEGSGTATEPPESAAPATESVTETAEPTVEATDPAAEATEGSGMLETAKTFEGAALEDLIAVIGEPNSSDYAPSCLGEGEDGNLYYDGFTVYTYRDPSGAETVNAVE